MRFWSWTIWKMCVNMFEIGRRVHRWIITLCYFDLFKSTLCLYWFWGDFKYVVSEYAIFIIYSLMWSFMLSSALKNLSKITSHSAMVYIFDLPSFIAPSSSNWIFASACKPHPFLWAYQVSFSLKLNKYTEDRTSS